MADKRLLILCALPFTVNEHAALAAAAATAPTESLRTRVEVEEDITTYEDAGNGAGPLWCYGSTIVARDGGDVHVSMIETGRGVPLLCNTRWQLWRRGRDSGWKLVQHERDYRQREPCPIGIFPGQAVFLSVNPSTQPPGTQYGVCKPLVLRFDPAQPAQTLVVEEPAWADEPRFTDHSYRGFAADGAARELLLLNIHSQTGEQYASYRDAEGAWHARGKIEYPIRTAYPQVALQRGAAHVLSIGDIVEPVESWRKLKFEKLQSKWDYVFRRLFYTYTPDIRAETFATPVEIDTVEKTAGHIQNLDLHVGEDGRAHLLYLRRPHQHAFIRDRDFPGEPMRVHLEYVILRNGEIASRQTLAEATDREPADFTPQWARFHAGPNESLYIIASGSVRQGGGLANVVGRVGGSGSVVWHRLNLNQPFGSFFTATGRGGSRPSRIVDLVGGTQTPRTLRYARIVIE